MRDTHSNYSRRMNIIRYEAPVARLNPFARFSTVTDEVGRLLDFPFFGRLNRVASAGWVPAFDLYEDKDTLTVRAELTGLVARVAAFERRKFAEQLRAILRRKEIVDDDMPERIAFAKARGESVGVGLQA